MKNFIKFLITCLTVIFVSCSLTPEVEVSPAQEYKITYTVSGTGKDAVTVNGPATAKSGDTVTFTIDGIEFDKRLVSVEYYYLFNSDCDYNEATGEYSFTMPGLNTPVTIIVEQLTDVSKDGAISWRGNQPSQIVPGDSVQELTFNVDASWTTSCTVELTSTDENVIPPSALTHKELKESDSNAITGITILESGCLTLMFTFLLRASTMDDARWASSMRSSRSLSTTPDSYSGMRVKCTDSAPGMRSR